MHLQIKYQQYSPQIQYLQQYELIQEQDIHLHSQDPFQNIQHQHFSFQEIVTEQSTDTPTHSYQEYLQSIIFFIPWLRLSAEYELWVKKGVNFIFGDVFTYAYYFNFKGWQILSQFKWAIIFQMSLFFFVLVCLSFEFTLLLLFALAYSISKEGNVESQIVKGEAFKGQFSNFSFKVKAKYHQSSMTKSALKDFTIILGQLVEYFKQKYRFHFEEGTFILDKIDQSIYQLNQLITRNNYAKKFITKKWSLPRKYYFWRLKIENKELTYLVQVMNTILQHEFQSKQVKYMKPKVDQSIYYTILLGKMQRQYGQVKNGKTDLSHFTSLLNLLNRQVQFKQIFNFHHRTFEQQQKNQEYQENEEVLPVFEGSARIQAQFSSYYYQDDSLVAYQPQQRSKIKQKLNHLLQQKLKKQQKQSNPTQISTTRVEPFPSKPERSIFSFGIPLIPPSRDMSAFYVE